MSAAPASSPTSSHVLVLGYGPVGREAAAHLLRAGCTVTVAQRTRPDDLPPGATFKACDVCDPDAVLQASQGAGHIVLAVGFAYETAIWRDRWPKAMAATLAAAAAHKARLVFVDNLYMYGPQTAPLREDMPLVERGGKPSVRAAITRQWMAEAHAGRVKVAALRAPDFYGPGVLQSHLGEVGFKAIAAGKPATLIARPDMPHAFAYTPDFGRGVATLVDAPDECFNQAWHLPCPPVRTPRELLTLGAAAIGRKARIQSLPPFLLGPMGLVSPFMREIGEMSFQWDRPYDVDWRKWAARFWADPTPHEVGVAETMRSFATQGRANVA